MTDLPKTMNSTALSDLRVLDLSRVRAGPTCVRLLADFGADVIRIEPPSGVDSNDNMFADKRGGGDFQNLNRNKRSLSLNLKMESGKKVLFELIKTADVVVENWRPDVKTRLGLSYLELKNINPRIILASISGFGQDGPYADRPGFDQIIQGMGGLMSVTGFPQNGPMRAGIAVADSSAGLFATIGILIALAERNTSGEGQWIQTSLLHSMISMMDFQAARHLNEGDLPVQAGNDHPTASPMGLFLAQDGCFNLGAAGDGNWIRLCKAIFRNDLLIDERFVNEKARIANRQSLNATLNEIFEKDTIQHWCDLLNRAGVPAGPVYNVPEVFQDPQVRYLDIVKEISGPNDQPLKLIASPITFSRTPAAVTTRAPFCGEHSDEILLDVGFTNEQITEFRLAGVI